MTILRHWEQLEFYVLKLPPSSDCDRTATMGVNSFFAKIFNSLLHSNSLWRHISRSIVPLTTTSAKLNVMLVFFSIIRIISLNTDSPFVCSHLPNSRHSSLIYHSLSTNCKHIDNCSVWWLSTSPAIKEKNLASFPSSTKPFCKLS